MPSLGDFGRQLSKFCWEKKEKFFAAAKKYHRPRKQSPGQGIALGQLPRARGPDRGPWFGVLDADTGS